MLVCWPVCDALSIKSIGLIKPDLKWQLGGRIRVCFMEGMAFGLYLHWCWRWMAPKSGFGNALQWWQQDDHRLGGERVGEETACGSGWLEPKMSKRGGWKEPRLLVGGFVNVYYCSCLKYIVWLGNAPPHSPTPTPTPTHISTRTRLEQARGWRR